MRVVEVRKTDVKSEESPVCQDTMGDTMGGESQLHESLVSIENTDSSDETCAK